MGDKAKTGQVVKVNKQLPSWYVVAINDHQLGEVLMIQGVKLF